jgi:hypothetical protein
LPGVGSPVNRLPGLVAGAFTPAHAIVLVSFSSYFLTRFFRRITDRPSTRPCRRLSSKTCMSRFLDSGSYMIQVMSGPEFFGIPIGKRTTGEWIFTYERKKGWSKYNVPPPAGVQPGKTFQTCLICSLTVTTLVNGDLLKLSAVHDAQQDLRSEIGEQEGALGRVAVFTWPVDNIPRVKSAAASRSAAPTASYSSSLSVSSSQAF